MPARDGTGPMGMGPMAGRGPGFYAGAVAPGPVNMNPGHGFRLRQGDGGQVGMGFGRGFRGCGASGGRCWRNILYATGLPAWARIAVPAAIPTPPQELAVLKQQAENLGSALESIRKRIQDLEPQSVEK